MFCTIIPAEVFANIAQKGTKKQRAWALETLSESVRLRIQRQKFRPIPSLLKVSALKQRTIYIIMPEIKLNSLGN